MNIYLKIYLICTIIITLCEMYNTYSVVATPNRFNRIGDMDPITWIIGSLFLGAIWPFTIILHIVNYFLVLDHNAKL